MYVFYLELKHQGKTKTKYGKRGKRLSIKKSTFFFFFFAMNAYKPMQCFDSPL